MPPLLFQTKVSLLSGQSVRHAASALTRDAMPQQLVFCRHPQCKHQIEVASGSFPTFCPKCGRRGRWLPVVSASPAVEHAADLSLAHNDYWLFLRRLHIARD